MTTTMDAHALPRQAAGCAAGHGLRTHGERSFARHYLEMVIAMIVGMLALGAAAVGIDAATGLELRTGPEATSLAMALAMAVAMVIWMRHRGHGWAGTLEMAGAMFAPAVALMPLLWLAAIGGDTLLLLEHVVMLPLMYLVMNRRRSEYGG